MTTDGRTNWWAKDAAWWRRELVVALGMEFGAEGPAVIDWLSCEAKAQNDGGTVKAGYRTTARGSFVDLERVRAIVSRSVTLSLLDDFAEDGDRFTCRISGWQRDQERGKAAARKAASRSGKPKAESESRPVTVGHAESPTGQDREPYGSPSSGRASLAERVEDARAIFEAFDLFLDDVSAAGALEAGDRRGVQNVEAELRGCAEYCREHPDKPVGLTLHRWLERAKVAEPGAGRTKAQREADDLAALERLTGGAA